MTAPPCDLCSMKWLQATALEPLWPMPSLTASATTGTSASRLAHRVSFRLSEASRAGNFTGCVRKCARRFSRRALSPTRACRDSLQRNQTQTLGQSSGSFPNDSTQTSSPTGLGLQHLQTVATPTSISSPCVSFSTEPTHLINGGTVRCWRFGAAARRQEGEYPSWIFDRRATPLRRQRSATLWAKLWQSAGGVAPQSENASPMLLSSRLAPDVS